MLVSYSWLKDYLKGKIPNAESLADSLTLHSFEVEDIRKSNGDWLIDVDVLSNRAHDCLSYLGIAREVAAVNNLEFLEPEISFKEKENLKTSDFVSVKIQDKDSCFRYSTRVIKGVKIKSSPENIKKRLISMGLQPINNVVDILNYVMLETGQPLHAFDFDKLESGQIIVKKAGDQSIEALDDKTYKLDREVLVIADKKDPLAIAGIKGGKKAEITKETKTIVIESANFEMRTIRKTRQKLSLQTDASLRFEHEPDPNLTVKALNRALQLIQEICGGEIAKGITDIYPKKVLPKRIKLNFKRVESVLGEKIKKEEINKIFKKLGFKIVKKDSSNTIVEIPTFRRDLEIEEDLIEEIGRLYGFDKIKPSLPKVFAVPPKENRNVFWENLSKDVLRELGLTEVYNYSFIDEKTANIFSLEDLIEIENPISSEWKYLRPSLIFNLLKNARENFKYFSGVKIFELGRVYTKKSEKRSLTGLISSKAEDFYLTKGIIDQLLEKLGISDIWYDDIGSTPEESSLAIWETGRTAEIKSGNEEIGFLGEINLKVLEKIGVSKKVTVFDLNFEKLQKLCSEENEYQPISRFPAAVRDLAVLISDKDKVVDVLNIINATGGILVRDVDLFDIYSGPEVPEGKKNLAFHIIYQAEDRTLEKEEIDDLQQKIITALEKNPEWEVRK